MTSGRSTTIERARRALAFVRYMPLSKLGHRGALTARRALRDRWPTGRAHERPELPLNPAPPLPLFKPRTGMLQRSAASIDGIRFLGVTHALDPARIDWNTPGPGARHQLWRMNLQYMEYLEDLPDAVFLSFVKQWIAANPATKRGGWRDSWNSYALSIRIVVWMQQLALRRSRLSADDIKPVVTSLGQQIRFLTRNLELDLGGNHLIKNFKALAWASTFFAGEEAQAWRATAVRLLAREVSHQVLADGMHDERSASYHAQVFADLLETRHALGGDPLGGALDETLQRMAQVIADMTHPDGRAALFNDAGISMAYAPGECLDVFEAQFNTRPAPQRVFAYLQAGYFGCRDGQSYFVADCGRIAPDDLPAHGHGDVLSFEWSVDGERIIVDQGVFEYIAGPKRQTARAAAFHNTLALQGVDQADFFGAFRCGRRPDVEVRRWQPRADGFVLEGSHNGFAHLPGRPTHIRRFDATARRVQIEDRIEGITDRQASIALLLHPACDVSAITGGVRVTRGVVSVSIHCTLPIAIEAAVWWPDMGHEQSTKRLRMVLPNGGTQVTTTLIRE